MNDQIWNIVTGNSNWMDWSEAQKSFPESKMVNAINWSMRDIISLMVLVLYGKSFPVSYHLKSYDIRDHDEIWVEWRNFKYVVTDVITHDSILVYRGHYIGSDW